MPEPEGKEEESEDEIAMQLGGAELLTFTSPWQMPAWKRSNVRVQSVEVVLLFWWRGERRKDRNLD